LDFAAAWGVLGRARWRRFWQATRVRSVTRLRRPPFWSESRVVAEGAGSAKVARTRLPRALDPAHAGIPLCNPLAVAARGSARACGVALRAQLGEKPRGLLSVSALPAVFAAAGF